MLVLGVDFETTGLDPAKDRVIEVGAVVWDVERSRPFTLLSSYCFDSGIPNPLPKEIEEITGITYEVLAEYGRQSGGVFSDLHALIEKCEAVVAHNGAQFDQGFYRSEAARWAIPLSERIWIDTALDIKYPERMTTRKLTHLAAEHGFLNPFEHRAVFDVLTMLHVAKHYDMAEAKNYASQPWLKLQAVVSFDDREKAKARGYRWNPDSRQWWKAVRLSEVQKERDEAGFLVKVLEEQAQTTTAA